LKVGAATDPTPRATISPVPSAPPRPRTAALLTTAAAAALALAAAAGFTLGRAHEPPPSSAVISRPTPNVILAVRDLSRLEAASFHMEKVVELTDEQLHFFGLVKAKDEILLIAVGEVIAGVDMNNLTDADIAVDPSGGVRLLLPAPEILSTAIDETHTHVYGRTTDLLATRKEELEGLARKEAAEQIEKGARDGGILDRARASAERTVRALLQSLGFRQVVVEWRAVE
jgi:hypothetical protein